MRWISLIAMFAAITGLAAVASAQATPEKGQIYFDRYSSAEGTLADVGTPEYAHSGCHSMRECFGFSRDDAPFSIMDQDFRCQSSCVASFTVQYYGKCPLPKWKGDKAIWSVHMALDGKVDGVSVDRAPTGVARHIPVDIWFIALPLTFLVLFGLATRVVLAR